MENTEKIVKNEEVKPAWKKVVYIALNVLFYSFIIFLLAFAIANISAKKHNNIPSIFGYGFLTVASDSMDMTNEQGIEAKKDSFKIGDLLIVKIANDKRIEKLTPEEDIITYFDANKNIFITHRLVDIVGEGNTAIYVTQGDKVEVTNPSANYAPGDEDMYMVEQHFNSEILAIYSGKMGGVGKVLTYLQTKAGFGLCIVLPTALLLIFEAYLLIKNLFEINRQKLAEEFGNKGSSQNVNFDIEEEKRKIREQLLAEMKKEEEAKKEEQAKQENKEE